MRRIFSPILLMTLLAAVLAGCGSRGNTEEATLRREPVSFPGAEPFTPPAGTDQPNVSPPSNAGGTFPGNTVGLFGGTQNETTCDKAQLIAFLQQDRAKAEAWAGVVGIQVDQIPTFVASLTPALLRSDTKVTNHGFKDGRATEIPAVLQAGTAVLVDVHGAPVAKCFCGNPLKAPPAATSEKFTGPEWSGFSSTNITVIVPVTQTVQQFVMVEPGSGQAFQRPAGTAGRQDAPATTPVPSTFPTPSLTTPSGTATTGSVPPPGVAVPSVTPPATSPSSSATGSASAMTSPTETAPSPTPTSPSPSESASPSETASPSPTASPTPSESPTSPSPSPTSASPSPTASASPSPTPTALRASWVVGDCFVQSGRAHGTVLVQADSPTEQRFTVQVQLGERNNPVALETVTVTVPPGQIGRSEVEASTSTPDGRVQCQILSIVDENGVAPTAGPPLPPPPDSVPMPAQPSPGQSTGPLPTPPNPTVPTPS